MMIIKIFIRVSLPIKIKKSLRHDIKFIVSRHEPLTEYKVKKIDFWIII